MALSPAGSDWTDAENDVLVANYFAMLADEMAGRAFVKRRHNAAVVADDRTDPRFHGIQISER